MELFRKLAGNFFFKIILSFVILTFVLFGISGFIFGNNNTYVAKIGDKVISYTDFIEASRSDREIIRTSTNSEEALRYLESQAFKKDVLGRLINKKVSEILAEEYGFIASQDLILKKIINDREFKNDDGKFDQTLFDSFLKKHSLDEERYINAISNEIMNAGVIQTFTITAPIYKFKILELANLRKEQRQVSLVEINKKRIGRIANPKEEDLVQYYEANKEKYRKKEFREVEVLSFDKKDLEKNFEPSEEELRAKYEEEKDKLIEEEKREFLHVVFDNKEEGDAFIQSLAGSDDLSKKFMQLAKTKLNKKLSDIRLKDITKNGLLPSIADDVFALKVGSLSHLLQSEIGYHLFLTTKITEAKSLEYSQARDAILSDLRNIKKENVVEDKISDINDIILESNALEKVIEKMNLSKKLVTLTFNNESKDPSGKDVKEVSQFGNLATNAFALDKGRISKIYYTQDYKGFYIFRVKNIEESRYMAFSDVKSQVTKDFREKKRQEELVNLANKISEEIKKDPKNAALIARKNGAIYRYSRKFDITNPARITNAVFSLKLEESTDPILEKDGNYNIAILRTILPRQASSEDFAKAKTAAIQKLRLEILRRYDESISAKYPVSINEKIFQN
ncbi:MAG: SurA N-terminal domain-containing protein [Rickettsiales bacterium]|nr:SurA N-terminal domain-containing protein [Rickettsiales bacterium]